MLDHISIRVSAFGRGQAFYDRALRPLGVSRVMGDGEAFSGYGVDGKPVFWIGRGAPVGGVHVAVAAPNRAAVDAFYAAAVTAGGRDNGPPGVRAHYHPNYYAAFVLDPDGANIEAVCHAPG